LVNKISVGVALVYLAYSKQPRCPAAVTHTTSGFSTEAMALAAKTSLSYIFLTLKRQKTSILFPEDVLLHLDAFYLEASYLDFFLFRRKLKAP
jgi:hypothetical protein